MSVTPYDFAERLELDPYSSFSPRFVVVIDTDALLSSIDNQCRTGRRSRLLRMADSRTVVIYAEDHVYGETYRGLRKLAASSSASVDELRACFEEDYLPLIHWVATDGDGIADERVKLVTDDTDVPTAELASLIAPCLVLSEDRALRRPGFAPAAWRAAAGHGAAVVRADSERDGAAMVVGLPPFLVIGGGIKLGEVVRLPWWASVGVMVVGGYFLLRNPDRREPIADKFTGFMETVGQLLEQIEERERADLQSLKGAMFEPASPPTIKQQVATILARGREPLLAQDVHARIERHFEGDLPTVRQVRDLLRDSSEFVLVDRYRWRLGRLASPWRPT